MKNSSQQTLLFSLLLFISVSCFAQQKEIIDLEEQFINPPNSARPQTWMHALNGNMSKEGLTKDLESLAEVGVGGILLFNIGYGIPSGNIEYNSPEHIAMLTHAAKESERLGLNFGVHNCDGWSASGGPWISPEQSMKMVVHSETIVNGGKEISLQLKQPTIRKDYYKDIAVLAYPSMLSELADDNNKPTISSSDKELDLSVISDGTINTFTTIHGSKEKPGSILYSYKKPFQLKSLSISTNSRRPAIKVYVSNDGKNFTEIDAPYKRRPGKKEFDLTRVYDGITTQYIKIETPAKKVGIYEIALSSTQFIVDQLARRSMSRTDASKLQPVGNPAEGMVINKSQIINLTANVDASGMLKTKLPKGNWTVLRFGYTSTGAYNNPATDSGRGLEVDKYHKPSVKVHYDAFTKKVVKAAMPLAPNAMQYVEIDSYEMGGQNWTFDYDKIFKDRFGYDLISFLPIYAGRFVESAAASEAVTYDIRKLNSELMVENYFGYFTELSHKDGIKTYIEPYGNGPMDNLATGGKADIPMGEFWTIHPIDQEKTPPTIVSSAVSAAHLYGKNIISAESFTAPSKLNWKGHPAMNKKSGDRIWTMGINEFMFHRFAHQPNTHVAPGMTMGPWGSHFDRTNTWWKNAGKSWFTYMARGQNLLRKGNPVYDFLVFPGDASPNPGFNPKLPSQIKHLTTNSEVLINRITVEKGLLKLPEGIEFKALILGNIQKIELPTLRRLKELSDLGATLIGKKPTALAAYKITKAQQKEFNALVSYTWGKPTTITTMNWDTLLPKLNVTADFTIKGKETADFIHRKTTSEDIYFFYNEDDAPKVFECSFNVNGKIPELWNPMTGEITKLAQFSSKNGKTQVPIFLENQESTFVIFRESVKELPVVEVKPSKNIEYFFDANDKIKAEVKANGNYQTTLSNGKNIAIKVDDILAPKTLEGSWEVEFKKENGYEGTHTFSELTDWKDHQNKNIKYYSGTAIYKKTFKISRKLLKKDRKLFLDLGKISVAARVILNGKDLGVSWIAPYEIEITKAAKSGKNELIIEVTNLWTNRLIGDEALPDTSGYSKQAKQMPDWFTNNKPAPESERHTFTVFNFYKRDKTLISSGLLGPVRIKSTKLIF
ncbi:glycosyl hydrolase [uncultured Polaribacter sp.]|uniref:glycosyl hydrolase n=1 Tax=uncultured Polaribacter sp. TaxID=174711 RepID=UPI002617EA84|nr:glycosyl hydrolase [uncultured Polaribacter sp.]